MTGLNNDFKPNCPAFSCPDEVGCQLLWSGDWRKEGLNCLVVTSALQSLEPSVPTKCATGVLLDISKLTPHPQEVGEFSDQPRHLE